MTVKLSTRALNKVASAGFDAACLRVLPAARRRAQAISPIETGNYRNSFIYRKCGDGVWGFGNTTEYADFVERGVRPFSYGSGRVIRFRASSPGIGGQFRFMRNHPGTTGQRVLQRSVDEAIERML